MSCPNCQSEIQPGQRFCPECGTRLDAACRSCGASLPSGAKFCPECGAATAGAVTDATADGSSAAPVAERRVVSGPFADLVGFTALSEGRDAEETRDLLAHYFELARERVERYGGTVEKFIGDAVMAVSGTPQAFEDDAERAVRAALDLVADVGRMGTPEQPLTARASVLTGEAAVTIGAKGQGMVAGDLVNTASRLQGAAEPGSVLVGEATRRAIERPSPMRRQAIRHCGERPCPIAALARPPRVGRRGGQGRGEGLEAPFVGRDDELALLKDLYHTTARERRARIISITGQAGIGKSRLAWLLQAPRRPLRAALLASGPLACLRRRRLLLGPRRDGPRAGRHRRRRGARVDVREVGRHARRVRHDPDERSRLERAIGSLLGLRGVGEQRGELLWRGRSSSGWPPPPMPPSSCSRTCSGRTAGWSTS